MGSSGDNDPSVDEGEAEEGNENQDEETVEDEPEKGNKKSESVSAANSMEESGGEGDLLDRLYSLFV